MIKEFLTTTTKETVIKIQANEINAIRSKNLTNKAVRIYDQGLIGISGAVGEIEDNVLLEQATENLKSAIEYPYEPSKELKDHRHFIGKTYTPGALKQLSEEILEVLTTQYPEFMFSHLIGYKEEKITLNNSVGLDLEYVNGYLSIGLVLKDRATANLMDGFLAYGGRSFDLAKFWQFNMPYLEAYKKTEILPVGQRVPVFFMELPVNFLNLQFNGERYATGSSIYSGKLGESLFNENLTLSYSRDSKHTNEPFFDMEGVVIEGNQVPIIEKGKFVNVCADKKTASDYNLPLTGGSSGEYDSRPTLDHFYLVAKSIDKDLTTILNGEQAIFVLFNSGGDFTPDGTYGSPVQVAFLYDGKQLLGKLPEFQIRSHINKMLGDDYIGTFDAKDLYFADDLKIHGYYMTVIG